MFSTLTIPILVMLLSRVKTNSKQCVAQGFPSENKALLNLNVSYSFTDNPKACSFFFFSFPQLQGSSLLPLVVQQKRHNATLHLHLSPFQERRDGTGTQLLNNTAKECIISLLPSLLFSLHSIAGPATISSWLLWTIHGDVAEYQS